MAGPRSGGAAVTFMGAPAAGGDIAARRASRPRRTQAAVTLEQIDESETRFAATVPAESMAGPFRQLKKGPI